MKYLSQFQEFAWERFAKGKRFLVMEIREWIDTQTKQNIGTKYSVVILEDRTEYHKKEENAATNLYEKFTVKCKRENPAIQIGTEIEIHNAEASVFGDFKNMLSVEAGSVTPVKGEK